MEGERVSPSRLRLGAAGKKLGQVPATAVQEDRPGCASEGHSGAPAMAPRALWSCYLCCLLTTAVGAASYPPRGYSLYTAGGRTLSPGGPQAQSAPRPASRHR